MNIPAPFTVRQHEYINRARESWLNVAEGGKRGSKNVLQTYIFCKLLETHPDRIHLIAGVSESTARLNIVDCDGYGIENYFEGRCRQGEYNKRSCLYVTTVTGEKIILISGGGKNGDEKLIKGNTYGMAYVTEANECCEKFLKEVFDRTMTSSNRKIFHDLNPKEPEHWYYLNILAHHERMQESDPAYGYNYGHFTIVDNMSLTDERIRSILKTYQKGTVWYDRDIKGKRVVAEGIIFRYLAEHPERYTCTEADVFDGDGSYKIMFDKLVMGIDFGGNGSKTTFNLTGYYNHFYDFIALEEDELPVTEEIDADRICGKFIEFYRACLRKYRRIDNIFPDSASTTMINSLRSVADRNGLDSSIISGCTKNALEDRPYTIDILLTTGRLKLSENCPDTIRALSSLKWDEKARNIPEDKNIGNINDRWDSFFYTLMDYIQFIDLGR